jgi:predicted SAM-dependent methyltransferase
MNNFFREMIFNQNRELHLHCVSFLIFQHVLRSGLPDVYCSTYQNVGGNKPNDHKIYQMVIKYTKWT